MHPFRSVMMVQELTARLGAGGAWTVHFLLETVRRHAGNDLRQQHLGGVSLRRCLKCMSMILMPSRPQHHHCRAYSRGDVGRLARGVLGDHAAFCLGTVRAFRVGRSSDRRIAGPGVVRDGVGRRAVDCVVDVAHRRALRGLGRRRGVGGHAQPRHAAACRA